MARAKTKRDGKKLPADSVFSTVVINRSAILHRNLSGGPFPNRIAAEELPKVRDRICEAAMKAPGVMGKGALVLKDGDADYAVESKRLVSYGLVSKSFEAHRLGGALLGGPDSIALFVNDEDHLTLTNTGVGSFRDLWRGVNTAAKALSKRLEFAFNPVYGYLSANPDNAGTGLRLKCSLSFFGLYLMKELEQVLRGIERMGFDVSPMYVLTEKDDNPLDAPGCCYTLISTQTMGREEEIIERMDRICTEVARQEENARIRLLESKPQLLTDFIMRSVAVGSVSLMMSESEGLDIVHAMLFAVDMGILDLSDANFLELQKVVSEITGPAVLRFCADPATAELDEIRGVRSCLIRTAAIKLLPKCLDGLGYGVVIKATTRNRKRIRQHESM